MKDVVPGRLTTSQWMDPRQEEYMVRSTNGTRWVIKKRIYKVMSLGGGDGFGEIWG